MYDSDLHAMISVYTITNRIPTAKLIQKTHNNTTFRSFLKIFYGVWAVL